MNLILQYVIYVVALYSMDRFYEKVVPEVIKKNAYLRLIAELLIIGLFIASGIPALNPIFKMELANFQFVIVVCVTVFLAFFMMRGNDRYKDNPIQGPLTAGQWAIFIWVAWIVIKAIGEKLS